MKNFRKRTHPEEERRTSLSRLQRRKSEGSSARRADERNFSLEGLRFTALLSQLQALQAVQGLTEFRPRGGDAPRFEVPEDPKERAMQRQWLTFKADWLEAMLEDTIGELESMDRYEEPDETQPKTED